MKTRYGFFIFRPFMFANSLFFNFDKVDTFKLIHRSSGTARGHGLASVTGGVLSLSPRNRRSLGVWYGWACATERVQGCRFVKNICRVHNVCVSACYKEVKYRLVGEAKMKNLGKSAKFSAPDMKRTI